LKKLGEIPAEALRLPELALYFLYEAGYNMGRIS
jgi:hypothetical protein